MRMQIATTLPMRIALVLTLSVAVVPLAQAAPQGPLSVRSPIQVLKTKAFAKSPSLRSLMYPGLPPLLRRATGTHPLTRGQIDRLRQALVRAGYLRPLSQKIQIPLLRKKPALSEPPPVQDRVLQRVSPHGPHARGFESPAITPTVSFDGLGASTGLDVQAAPPDTDVAVGVNDVVEIVNGAYGSLFQIYDKSGTLIGSPVLLSNLWSNIGGTCTANGTGTIYGGLGDGVVTYDQLAERYVITQFAGVDPTPTDECIAISVTSDPTGAYYLYDFPVFPGDFADYPKVVVWPDAYYASFNVFDAGGTTFLGEGFVAFERQAMLEGNPSARMVIIQGNGVDLAYSALPANLDGMTSPPAGSPGLFVDYVSPTLWGTTSPYALMLWQLHVDWATPADSMLSGPTAIDVAPFNDELCTGLRNCIPEPSPGETLDALSDRLMFRLAYRNGVGADGHQALVVNQTVGESAAEPPSGIRWYELDAPAGSTDPTQWGLVQQSTFAPADGTSRWMGSIAMDASGDMALGYSLSSPNIDPSVAFTGRLASDPPDQMTLPETPLVAGNGVQEGTQHRWGDYSSMVLDPTDDCTFWYAQEFYAVSGSFNWSTHLGAFTLDSGCALAPRGVLSGQVTDAATGNPLAGAIVSVLPNRIEAITDQNGNYTLSVPAGGYTLRANTFGYQQEDQTVSVSGGQTFGENFALQPSASVTVSGTVSDAGHGYGLYAEVEIDAVPGIGQVADVWTNPRTGHYSVNLPQGYDYSFTVKSYLKGFAPGYATIQDLSGASTQDFALAVGAGCSAPGYGDAFGEDFDHGFPPPGWNVTNAVAGSPVVWLSNGEWTDSNFTGGQGAAASVDSVRALFILNYSGVHDTSLISPPIAVTSLPATPVLRFALNYHSGAADALDVDQSIDNGSTWSTLATVQGNYGVLYGTDGNYGLFYGPPVIYRVPLSIPSGTQSIRLRWRDHSLGQDSATYVQIDDVGVGRCDALAGSLVVGTVTAQASGSALSGATVFDNQVPPGSATTHAPSSATPNLPPGFYFLFTPTAQGSNLTLTAAHAGYASKTQAISVSPGALMEQDFALGSTRLSTTPGGFDLHVMVNNQITKTLTVTNNGTSAGRFHLLSVDSPPPATFAAAQTPAVPLMLIHCAPLSFLTLTGRNPSDGQGSGGCSRAHPATLDTVAKAPASAGSPWRLLSDYPVPIMDNAVATNELTGKVYSVGGDDLPGGVSGTSNSYLYDPVLDQWSPIADVPDQLQGSVAAFLDGKLYVAFGRSDLYPTQQSLYVYTPATNTWSLGPDAPVAQGSGVAAAVLDNTIYFVGGCSLNGLYRCASTTVQVYDPLAQTWHSVAPYPHPVSWASCGALGDKLYCAGGVDNSIAYADGYVYDPRTNAWSPIAPIPVTAGGLWGSAYAGTPMGLIVSGGVTDNSTTLTNQGFLYAPASNSWSTLANAPDVVFRSGSTCGFYRIGGSTVIHALGLVTPPLMPTSAVERLPGYGSCSASPIPWLTLSPASATVPLNAAIATELTFDGTGEPEDTTSQAYLMLTGEAPYVPDVIPLTVHWDPQPVDLALSASANRRSLNAGGALTYTLKVSNLKEPNHGSATAVVLTAQFPASVASIVPSGSAACAVGAKSYTCDLGSVTLGANEVETLSVKPTETGMLNATFSVSAREPDSDTNNNKATVVTTVQASGGGGGGGLNWLVLLMLATLAIARDIERKGKSSRISGIEQ